MARDPGSTDPRPLGETQIVFASNPQEKIVLVNRSNTLETTFRQAPLDRLQVLASAIANLHQQLFKDLCGVLPEAAGTYRGTVGTKLHEARRIVVTRGTLENLNKVDPCTEPDQVPFEMAALLSDIQSFWQAPVAVPVLPIISEFTHRFFAIHPFLDGNGHVWRLILIALARRASLSISSEWTVAQRPYGPEFSLALQQFPVEPELLALQLKTFFRP